MPRIDYYAEAPWKPREATRLMIARANAICGQYRAQGFDLTLRQLYYQFVKNNWLPNKQQSYDNLGATCVKAREHGLMDWSYLIDRGRNMQQNSHWDSPQDVLDAVAKQFAIDKWANQDTIVEVWVEKEAQVGTIARAARALDIPWYACKGYNSSSEVWGAAQRLGRCIENGQRVVVLYLGDHDPSGLQMVEDIQGRLRRFIGVDLGGDWYADEDHLEVRRIALNYDQIQERNLPPNPAKESDSRYDWYVRTTGLEDSWELDALDPNDIVAMIRTEAESLRDPDNWDLLKAEEARHKALMAATAKAWPSLTAWMEDQGLVDPYAEFVDPADADDDE